MPKSNFSWHKYIRILKTIRTNIRIYSYQKNDTNEYTNIFVSKKSIRTNIRIYSYQKNDTNMIRTNIRIGKYSNIFEYPNIHHTLSQNCWFQHILCRNLGVQVDALARCSIRIHPSTGNLMLQELLCWWCKISWAPTLVISNVIDHALRKC